MTTSRQDKAGGVADEELLRLARKWAETDQVECAEDQCALGVYIEHTHDPLLVLHTASKRRRAALHAALLVIAGEVDLQALLDARAAFVDRLRSALAEYESMRAGVRAKPARDAQAMLGSAFGLNVRDFVEGQAEGAVAAIELLLSEYAPAEGAGK